MGLRSVRLNGSVALGSTEILLNDVGGERWAGKDVTSATVEKTRTWNASLTALKTNMLS